MEENQSASSVREGWNFLQDIDCESLSSDIVLELHAILTDRDSSKGAGKLRDSNAVHVSSDGPRHLHFLPPPHLIPSTLHAILKKFTCYMKKRQFFEDKKSPEYINFICRCAAQLLYDLVTLHPFVHCSRTVAILLAYYTLALISPVPVELRDSDGQLYNKERFVTLIAHSQAKEDGKPISVATMLLNSFWLSIKHSQKDKRMSVVVE